VNRILGLTILVMGMATALFAGNTSPEIDASTGAAAVALLSGGILVLRARRKQ
jgi:uncharacterized protein (TIGR03382 family)